MRSGRREKSIRITHAYVAYLGTPTLVERTNGICFSCPFRWITLFVRPSTRSLAARNSAPSRSHHTLVLSRAHTPDFMWLVSLSSSSSSPNCIKEFTKSPQRIQITEFLCNFYANLSQCTLWLLPFVVNFLLWCLFIDGVASSTLCLSLTGMRNLWGEIGKNYL